jgi:hypothetical protein
MAIPALKLNLVPSPTTWRRYHELIGWCLLASGFVCISAVTFLTFRAYLRANTAGRQAVALTNKAQEAARQETRILDELKSIDVAKEQPRWRLAERVLIERSVPWSRITAEMERSLVQDVRLKSIQRIRSSGGQGVQIKLKCEARTRDAEEEFIRALLENHFFLPAEFEREAERQGGGIEFELTLPVNPTPLAYVSLPKYGRTKKVSPDPAKAPKTIKPSKKEARS